MVYFILNESTDQVKIGITRDISSLKRRLTCLQVGNPQQLKVIALVYMENRDDKYTEQSLHRKFRHYRVKGEWYKFCNEIETFTRSVALWNSIDAGQTMHPVAIQYVEGIDRYIGINKRLDAIFQYSIDHSKRFPPV